MSFYHPKINLLKLEQNKQVKSYQVLQVSDIKKKSQLKSAMFITEFHPSPAYFQFVCHGARRKSSLKYTSFRFAAITEYSVTGKGIPRQTKNSLSTSMFISPVSNPGAKLKVHRQVISL